MVSTYITRQVIKAKSPQEEIFYWNSYFEEVKRGKNLAFT